MTSWYPQLSGKPDIDENLLGQALEWFAEKHADARKFFDYQDVKLEDAHKHLPGLMMYYFEQVQDLEAILEWLEVLQTRAIAKARRFYTESYARTLSERQVERWAEGDAEVLMIKLLIVEVAFARNRHLSITKGLEMANFQLGHINHLRRAGIEDATL